MPLYPNEMVPPLQMDLATGQDGTASTDSLIQVLGGNRDPIRRPVLLRMACRHPPSSQPCHRWLDSCADASNVRQDE